MRRALFLLCLLAGLLSLPRVLRAQEIRREDFVRIDTAIVRLGPMRDSSLGAIARALTGLCRNQPEMAHAFYYWTAMNIAFDCAAWHHPKGQNNSVTAVLQERKAVAEGYAELYRQLCGQGHLACRTVHGWAKSFPSDIGAVAPRQRHCWNVVSLNDLEYAVDVTWAAGATDKKMRHFNKEYSDVWYGTNRRLFVLCHYPDDKRQQLLDTPVAKAVYTRAPVVGSQAVALDLYPEEETRGRLRAPGTDSVIELRYWVKNPKKIAGLSLLTDKGGLQPLDYTLQDHLLAVRVPLAGEPLYEAGLCVNGRPAFGYLVQGRKKRRR